MDLLIETVPPTKKEKQKATSEKIKKLMKSRNINSCNEASNKSFTAKQRRRRNKKRY